MSVAHLVVVPEASVAHIDLTPVAEVHDLVYDHKKIIERAVHTLRASSRVRRPRAPMPGRLQVFQIIQPAL